MPGYDIPEKDSRWYACAPDGEVMEVFEDEYEANVRLKAGVWDGTYPKGSYLESD